MANFRYEDTLDGLDGQSHNSDEPATMQENGIWHHVSDADSSGASQSKRCSTKRRRLKDAAKSVVKKVHPHSFAEDDRPILNHVRQNAAFNPNIVEKQLTRHYGNPTGIVDRSRAVAETVKDVAIHPKRSIQAKIKKTATSKLTVGQRPHASKADEFDFLIAHSETSNSAVPSSDEDMDSQSRVELLESRQDSLRTAWTMSRLRRVRVVPCLSQPFPQQKDFYESNDAEQIAKFDFLRWVGHILLYLAQDFSPTYIDEFEELPYDLLTTRTHVERLVLGTGQWQTWAMDVRSVYRWEDPWRTARWFALYVVLWYNSWLPAFFWAYILYYVISNRFKRRSLRHLRTAAKKSLDRESTASQLGELIDRHGQAAWADHLIQEVGPSMQLQLGDIANALEVLDNFYAWKSPHKTISTLCFFATCLACSLFTDMEFCMKIVYFTAGGAFFFCFPVSSRYPQYRYLVSPLKWVFWGIPTHAELSFEYLRKHAQVSCEKIIRQKVDETHHLETSSPPLARYTDRMSLDSLAVRVAETAGIMSNDFDDEDENGWQSASSDLSIFGQDENMVGFRAQCDGAHGRLYIYSTGVRFYRSRPREELWSLRYQDLTEMLKAGLRGRRKLTLGGLFDSGILQLRDRSGTVRTLNPIKYRDEAFNCIIGFSGLRWQEIQTEPGKGRKPAR